MNNELKTIREKLNLTQGELAKKLGVSRFLIGSVERGERNLSESLINKIDNYLNNATLKKSGWEKYREGNNFAKIIGALEKEGVDFVQLRDNEFKVKGSDLSRMYIGIKPIPSKIKAILEDKFNVNPEYIQKGKIVPMFTDSRLSQKFTPYFKGLSLVEALKRFETFNLEDIPLIPVETDSIALFVDLQGDNIPAKLEGKTIIGLSERKISIDSYGRLFLIRLKSGEVILRRIHPSSKSNEVLLRKEDPNFQDIPLAKNKIAVAYMVVSAYLTEFI